MTAVVGFDPEEVDFHAPTRSARLKWVIVVDEAIPVGRATNAAACVAAATADGVFGLLGDAGTDLDGRSHPGLPWAGCSILRTDHATLQAIRAKALGREDIFVADMPEAAQATRIYAEYLAALATSATDTVSALAVSLVGPRNRIDRIVGRLPLLD